MGHGKGGAGQWVPIGEVHDIGEIELVPAPAGWRGGGQLWGRRVGSSGRCRGPPHGQPRAALRAATRTASGGAAGCLLNSYDAGSSRCVVRRGHSVQGIRLRVNIEKNH
jgi:hypothetical protein